MHATSRYLALGLAVASAIVITTLAFVPPAVAASAIVHLSLRVAPSPVVDGGTVTWTGVVSRRSGSPTNVRLTMESHWYMISVGSSFVPAGGTCAPASHCTVDDRTGSPTWVLPSVASSVTITFTTQANSAENTYLYLQGGAGCDASCPAVARIAKPVPSVSVSVAADHSPVMPGTTLHVTVRGTATAGPMDADLHATLGSGLEAPTNLAPPEAVYAPPPYHYIDDPVTLDQSPRLLTFDTVVTAPVGSDVQVAGYLFPVNSKYGNASRAVTVHVGPVTWYQQSSSRLRYAGTWTRSVSTSASGGSTKYATRAGASVTFRLTGRWFAWLAPVGPTRGSARVYVDGTLRRTVSLYRTASQARVIVYRIGWPSAGPHTVRIVVVGTKGHPRVDVDAVGVTP